MVLAWHMEIPPLMGGGEALVEGDESFAVHDAVTFPGEVGNENVRHTAAADFDGTGSIEAN